MKLNHPLAPPAVLYYDTFATPVGPFSAAVDAVGAVVATAFGDLSALQSRLRGSHLLDDKPASPRRYTSLDVYHPLDDKRAPGRNTGVETGAARAPRRPLEWRRDAERTTIVRAQVFEYFAGQRREFDLPIEPWGTAFQQSVWRALRRIPFGETRTYGQIATALGSPTASRAVGGANGANPVCLIIPCHRVIGSDGSLTGFAFGEEIKRRLLQREATVADPNCSPGVVAATPA